MLVLRGPGGLCNQLGGLGQDPASGWCFINGAWQWTAAAGCPNPLIAGGPPMPRAGYCWIRQNPPNPFPGYWARQHAGEVCGEPPPAAPTGQAGFCQDATGAWRYVLASQCAVPVLPTAPLPLPREHRSEYGGTPGGGVVVTGSGRGVIEERRQKLRTTMDARLHNVVVALINTGQVKTCVEVSSRSETAATHEAGVRCRHAMGAGNFKLLDPIGVIVELGVPFSPDELAAGRLERTYAPDVEQRFIVDLLIYTQSQRTLLKAIGWSLPHGEWGPDVPDYLTSPVYAEFGRDGELQRGIDRSNASINQFISNAPEYTFSLDNYGLNPPAPTQDELTQPGGLKGFYRRGGYLINRQIADGTRRVGELQTRGYYGLRWNTGYCACANGTPIATYQVAPKSGSGWDVYVAVGPQYKIVIKPGDTPFWSGAVGWLAEGMRELGSFICQNQPVIQQLNKDVLLKELCHDVAGKPCAKGTKGCYCSSPTNTQQAAVGVANAGIGLWCARAAEWLSPKKEETPFTPPQMAPVALPWTSFVPWVLGGLLAGAGAFALTR